MLELVLGLYWLVTLAIVVLLIVKYRSIGDTGLLVLLVALVVWPLCAGLLSFVGGIQMDRLAEGKPVVFPFTLVQAGNVSLGSFVIHLEFLGHLVRQCLALLSVWMLYRSGKCAQLLGQGSPRPGAVQPTG